MVGGRAWSRPGRCSAPSGVGPRASSSWSPPWPIPVVGAYSGAAQLDCLGFPSVQALARRAHGDAHGAGRVPDHDPAGRRRGAGPGDPVLRRLSSWAVRLPGWRCGPRGRCCPPCPWSLRWCSASCWAPRHSASCWCGLRVRRAGAAVGGAAGRAPAPDRARVAGRVLRAAGAAVATLAAVRSEPPCCPTYRPTNGVVLRGRVGSGQDVSQLDNPLASFRRYTRQPAGTADNLADRRLLRVSGPAAPRPTCATSRWTSTTAPRGRPATGRSRTTREPCSSASASRSVRADPDGRWTCRSR